MKKVLIICMCIVLCLLAVACSETDSRTLDDFRDAFTSSGYDLSEENEPLYVLIGAINGFMFYADGEKVAIYEYKDSSALEDGLKEYTYMAGETVNGKFLLETDDTNCIEIFKAVQ